MKEQQELGIMVGSAPRADRDTVDGYRFEPIRGQPMLRWAGKRPFSSTQYFPAQERERQGVSVLVVKNSRSRLLHNVDVAQFNAQYANSLTVKVSDKFHDRFLVIDRTTLIHVGASLNHLGKKCFAFASLDKSNIPDILARI